MVVILPFVTANVTPVPWNRTAVVPKNPEPKMETGVPTWPLCGEKPVMVGTVMVTTVKLAALVAVPAGVVRVIFPSWPRGNGGLDVRRVDDRERGRRHAVESTAVAPREVGAVDVTEVPTPPRPPAPLVGMNPVMLVTLPVTVKLPPLVAVPFGRRHRDRTVGGPNRHGGEDLRSRHVHAESGRGTVEPDRCRPTNPSR